VNTKPKSIATPSQPPVVKQELRPEKVATPPTTTKPTSQLGSVSPSIKTQQPPKNAALPLYVVQVFSSPSRDDADEWLQSLREKKVPNGYIVEQPIKGRPWYRVRFGEYTTRQDAEAAALRYGITQPWIARVR
jgi:septal ring-binding cell division protein DamX